MKPQETARPDTRGHLTNDAVGHKALIAGSPYERVPVGFGRTVILLMDKNLIQQVRRRWLSTTFKLLMPMLCLLIMGLIKIYVLDSRINQEMLNFKSPWDPRLGSFGSGCMIVINILMLIYPFCQACSQLIREKSFKIKESLQQIGVSSTTYWTSWFLWLSVESTIIAILIWIMTIAFNWYPDGDKLILFLHIELFCVNYAAFGALLSTLFDSPKIASLISFFLFVASMSAGWYSTKMNRGQKAALSLIGPASYSMSFKWIEAVEGVITWSNIDQLHGGFRFSTCLLFLFFDSILYVVLTLYFDRVWPSKYGQRRHPLFFIPGIMKRINYEEVEAVDTESAQLQGDHEKGPSRFEVVDDKNPLIRIRNLKKTFRTWSGSLVRAVNGINLDIFEGSVFCLLGHNGAGKTTTIDMLTGSLQSTSGDAWINGQSMLADMDMIRKNLGVCPQHDVLLPRLTSAEHLEMFARLKGVPESHVHSEVSNALLNGGIMDKCKSFPHQMSGGEKRKLSLALALIGGSRIIFLDEPTTGMDPESRRVTWDLIQREKRNRCIILTTHFMDEADVLGDRVAIMNDGLIKCCGSSLFLKRSYGVGYTFQIALNIGVRPRSVKPKIDGVILKNIIGSSCLSAAGAELTYRLPFHQTESFPKVFEELDARTGELDIKAYGISVTTLEEVFLKIGMCQMQSDEINSKLSLLGEECALAQRGDAAVDIDDDTDSNPFEQPTYQLEGKSEFFIFWRHICAILVGRFYLAIRGYRSLFFLTVLPCILCFLHMFYIVWVMIPIGAICVVVNDRANRTKHQQLVSGVSCFSYWCANYIADVVTSLPLALCIWISMRTLLPGGWNEMLFGRMEGSFVLLLLLFVLAIISFTYLVSWCFSSSGKAQVVVGGVYTMLFIFLAVAVFFDSYRWAAEQTKSVKKAGLEPMFGFVEDFCAEWVWVLISVCNIIPIHPWLCGMARLIMNKYIACDTYRFRTDEDCRAHRWRSNQDLFTEFQKDALTKVVEQAEQRTGFECMKEPLIVLAAAMVIYFLLVLLIEIGNLKKWWNRRQELQPSTDGMDEDVVAEMQRIQTLVSDHRSGRVNVIEERKEEELQPSTDGMDEAVVAEMQRIQTLVSEHQGGRVNVIEERKKEDAPDRVLISNLHKKYGKVHAVRGVHLGVKQGEVFGYLGVNGAGKTSTLACLTGNESATCGDAYVNGYSIAEQSSVRRFIGFCPQDDALFPLLTGREHLKFYGKVKGLRGAELSKQVNLLLEVLSLGKYADRAAGTYSGGNKRKLSVAMSMIGNPPILFLDEPSSGMDPIARRGMWEFIRTTMSGRCVILTTHSMEECEALCHRLCIMAAGQLKCLGTPQHLKSLYSHGYQLDLTLETTDGEGETEALNKQVYVEMRLTEMFNAVLIEKSQKKLVYEVTFKGQEEMTLANMFRAMEECKQSLPIESYALNQTTLEQVFLKMARSI